jgi:hypothetical protein
MKNIISTVIVVAFVGHTQAQTRALVDSTGLPGDGFDLAGAVELFKQAPNLEAFERALNEEASQVNNLDLDGDERVDHIRVVDHHSGDAHAIVLQVALSQSELQDVAVIELEKTGEAAAMLQIRGAEELYGTDVLVEPLAEEDAGTAPTKGPSAPELARVQVWVNVWAWPCVTWIYGPSYVVWESPWYWGHYPPWWRPWRPMGWRAWYRWNRPYHVWYRPVYVCSVPNAHAVYRPRASYSPRIHRTTAPIRQQRAAMRSTKPDERTSPSQRMDRRQRDVRGKERSVPRTRPIERAPRTRPAQRAPRTAPAPRAPRPARTPAPSRAPRRR